jgi:hypothetical protein
MPTSSELIQSLEQGLLLLKLKICYRGFPSGSENKNFRRPVATRGARHESRIQKDGSAAATLDL